MRFEQQMSHPARTQRDLARLTAVRWITICAGLSWAFGGAACACAQAPPLSFNEVCFLPVGRLAEADVPVDWQASLHQVPGHDVSIQPINPRAGQGCRFHGLARIPITWTDDTLLRLQLRPNQVLSLHIFNGNHGVSILYDAGLRGWSAYATTREANAPRPLRQILAATDNSRARRSEFDKPVPLALSCRNGELVLTRGDLVLLGAPFTGQPQEVYLDGRAEIQAMDVLHCEGQPTAKMTDNGEPIRPASLKWNSHLGKGAKFETLDTGSVRLSGDRVATAGWATTPIPGDGPRELLVRLDHVAPGTGLFLTPADPHQPAPLILFVRNQQDGRTCVVLSEVAHRHERNWPPSPGHSIPYVGDTVWLRMVFGAGNLRWWCSMDGRHWAEAEQPISTLKPHSSQLGLYHLSSVEQCRIEVGQLQIRPLPMLASCCGLDLKQLARTALDRLSLDDDLTQWNRSLVDTCPTGTEAELWSRTCAVTALGAGCTGQLGAELLNQLMDHAADAQWPLANQLRLFHEAALLADSRYLAARGPALPNRYFALGTRAWRQDGLPPLSSIRRALMETALDRHGEIAWTVGGVISEQIFDLVYREQWSALRDQCGVLDFFGLFSDDALVAWADQLSATRLQKDPVIVGSRTPALPFYPLLSEELNRDTYNYIVELDHLVKSRRWDAAARYIADSLTTQRHGVAPAPDDPALLSSSRVAIRAALLRYPELRSQMELGGGELIQLRVERAIRRQGTSELAQLAEQFPGLEAACQAETWLADQLLAGGRVAEALQGYRRAAASPATEASERVRARLRIAAALSGQDLDSPANSEVRLGDFVLSPEELNTLTNELLQYHRVEAKGTVDGSGASLFSSRLILPGNRIALQLAAGKDPDKEILAGVDRLRVDWPGRQLAAVRVADLLLVHNRFELVALDWSTGNSRWTSHPMGEQVLSSRDWPLIPMRPLVLGDRVLARHLSAKTPQLACWELDSGRLLWTGSPDSQIPISDPFLMDRSLAVLTLDEQRSVDAVLHLQIIDAVTGRYTRTIPLLRVRDNWWQRSSCQVLTDARRTYVVLGGLSFSCDSAGELYWIRTSTATPPEADQTSILQVHQPPLLSCETLILAQPGVRAIEAVDPITGVLKWRTVMPHLHQVIGISGEKLFVKSQDGLSALAVDTGKIQWQHRDTNLLLAACSNARGGIVYTRSRPQPGNDGKRSVQLVRLDPETGNVRDAFTFDQLDGSTPNVGPLVVGDDKTWAFFSAGTLGGQREMVELRGEENSR